MKTRVKEGAESGELEGLATTRKFRVVRFQKLGTDPTIVNKIKGLRGFGGRVEGGAGAVVQICHCQYYN